MEGGIEPGKNVESRIALASLEFLLVISFSVVFAKRRTVAMSTVPGAGNSLGNGFSSSLPTSFVVSTPPGISDARYGSLNAVHAKVMHRLPLLDVCKGLAACLIVAHHLTFYGRPADLAMQVAPELIRFLFDDARMVVQFFLVMGGFAMAWPAGVVLKESLSQSIGLLGAGLAKRYFRLLVPFGTMLILILVIAPWLGAVDGNNPLVQHWELTQFLLHLLFLHNALGYDGLTAGAWYLCIDLQFAFLFCGLTFVAEYIRRRWLPSVNRETISAAFLASLAIGSAWYWNRHDNLDWCVLYFLAPLGMGATMAWQLQRRIALRWWVLLIVAIACSLTMEFRPRLIVSLASCGVIGLAVRIGGLWNPPRILIWLGKISYSLFVSHYLVITLTMHFLDGWMAESPWRAWVVMMFGFLLSLAAAELLYRLVESPFQNWLRHPSSGRIGIPRLRLGAEH